MTGRRGPRSRFLTAVLRFHHSGTRELESCDRSRCRTSSISSLRASTSRRVTNDFVIVRACLRLTACSKRKKAYNIGVPIGAGGYGEVKQATALELDNLQVAIKIVPKMHVRDLEEQVERQNSLLLLKHPHVVHLIEWFE